MQRVLCVALAVTAAAALYAAAVPDGERWWSYVEALANDDMKRRNTGSPEHLKSKPQSTWWPNSPGWA